MNDEKPKHGRLNWWLVGILVFFVVLIVGLSIALVVLKPGDDESFSSVGCEEGESSESVILCIEENYSDDEEGALAAYNVAVADAKEKQNYERFADLVIAKSSALYVMFGDCNGALEAYSSEDYDQIGDNSILAKIYSYAVSQSLDCDNLQAQSLWQERMNDTLEGDGSGYGF